MPRSHKTQPFRPQNHKSSNTCNRNHNHCLKNGDPQSDTVMTATGEVIVDPDL